ncbi:MAG: DnaJ domain-containing protein [Planctomycetes bacterium]|nr:DnaJ domain-containing protein [Planctomycetota bacterium]
MGKKRTGRGQREARRGTAHGARKGKARRRVPESSRKRTVKGAPRADLEPRPAASRRSLKHTEGLLVLAAERRSAFFETTAPGKLLAVFEESYPSELVKVLLDLKRSVVKVLLETLARLRKRAVAETATLYHYKEYLTNPLPLRVDTDAGISIPNFYAILGVPRDATEHELKEAHRLLARAHGEDMFSPDMQEVSEERLREIDEAYANLKTPERRAKTDRLLPNVSYLYPRRDQSWLEAVRRLLA